MTTTRRQGSATARRQRRRLMPIHDVILMLSLLLFSTLASAQEESVGRQVERYDLPAFSMLLRVEIDEMNTDDDNPVYLDLEIFQETLERVTQLHLTDIFQQEQVFMQNEEDLIKVQLSSKVRQDVVVQQDHAGSHMVHVPLHAAFSGVVSYSFPMGKVPRQQQVDEAIFDILESALIGDNYFLLLRRYLSSGVLADIENVQDVRIGTQLLEIAEGGGVITMPPLNDEDTMVLQTSSSSSSSSNSKNKKKQLNAVTIVAIVIFLTLSCLLMVFGATVVLLMKDRAKQEARYNGQTMTSIGMGDDPAKSSTTADEDDDDEEEGNTSSADAQSVETTTPAWKRAVLPVLRKAIMVRRYWRKHMRKQRRQNKSTNNNNKSSSNPNEAAGSSSSSVVAQEGDADYDPNDDGLNDEDIYYDEGLTDEEAANQWLDAWSQSITSIPVRTIASTRASGAGGSSPSKKHVKKKKSSKMPLAPRPAKRQSKKAFLCCIAEEDSVIDGSSVHEPTLEGGIGSPRRRHSASDLTDLGRVVGTPPLSRRHSTTTPRGNNTTKICLELDRIQELASVIMEEEYPPPPPTSSSETTTTFSYGTSVRRKSQLIELASTPTRGPLDDDDDDDDDDIVHDGFEGLTI